MQPKLILASSSRYRRELLDRLGLDYETLSPDVDESPVAGETPQEAAVRLARLKARAVARQRPGYVVIGSDQTADLAGHRIGKPGTRERAIEQLLSMQGADTTFTTALCVIDVAGNEHVATSFTHVKMRPLSRETIEAYVDREKPWDCAGSAKIECLGIALMEEVSSDDPTSLIGLPLMKLTTLLAQAGIEVLPGITSGVAPKHNPDLFDPF